MLPRNQGESKNYVNINKKILFGKIDVRLQILHIPVVAGDRENYLYAVDRFLPCFYYLDYRELHASRLIVTTPSATYLDVDPRIELIASVIEQKSRGQSGQYIDEIMCLYIDGRQCQTNTDGQEVPE